MDITEEDKNEEEMEEKKRVLIPLPYFLSDKNPTSPKIQTLLNELPFFIHFSQFTKFTDEITEHTQNCCKIKLIRNTKRGQDVIFYYICDNYKQNFMFNSLFSRCNIKI